MINRELITKDDKMYEVVSSVSSHMFLNKDKSLNQQVLGLRDHLIGLGSLRRYS